MLLTRFLSDHCGHEAPDNTICTDSYEKQLGAEQYGSINTHYPAECYLKKQVLNYGEPLQTSLEVNRTFFAVIHGTGAPN